MHESILTGVRVLDFTRVAAGPYATRILADFGAEVIKIQTAKTASGSENNAAGYFSAWNRNKKSITLNMSRREARGLFLRLTAQSDVVAENFTPRVMANWELDYDRLKRAKGDIIMLSMSGMGQTGPWKDFSAYGPTLQALGGLTWLTAFSPDAPMGLGYSYADPILGLYGAVAVLAALENRAHTGKGLHIDLAGLEAVCTMLGQDLMEQSSGRDIPPAGNTDRENAAPHGCYRCRGEDRWCVIAAFDDVQWRALCRTAEHHEWVEDGRFRTFEQREKHRAELDALLEAWTVKLPAEETVRRLQEAGVPAGIVQNAADLAADPQLSAREFFATLRHPLLGDVTSDTYPFRFPDEQREGWRAAPLLGEHNDYVFRNLLGLSEAEFNRLKEKGVIA